LAAIIVVAYSVISVRFSKAVQPLRLRVMDDIDLLCRDENLPDDVKADLKVLSGTLFSKLNGWLIVVLFPIVIVKSTLRSKKRTIKPQLTGRLRFKVTQTVGMGMFCMIATSPLCTVIFAVEFILSLMISGPWSWVRSLMRTVATVDEQFASLSKFAKT
jgi:hypothetical protein